MPFLVTATWPVPFTLGSADLWWAVSDYRPWGTLSPAALHPLYHPMLGNYDISVINVHNYHTHCQLITVFPPIGWLLCFAFIFKILNVYNKVIKLKKWPNTYDSWSDKVQVNDKSLINCSNVKNPDICLWLWYNVKGHVYYDITFTNPGSKWNLSFKKGLR